MGPRKSEFWQNIFFLRKMAFYFSKPNPALIYIYRFSNIMFSEVKIYFKQLLFPHIFWFKMRLIRYRTSYMRLCNSLMGYPIKKCVGTKAVGNWFLILKHYIRKIIKVNESRIWLWKIKGHLSQKAPLNFSKIHFFLVPDVTSLK